MKIIHTGDWHLGKIVNEFSMLSDQIFALEQMERIIQEEKADVLMVAGDIYDRGIPTLSAVTLLNDFLTRMSQLGCVVIMISGNHDSPERLSFAGEILENHKLYIRGNLGGADKRISLKDEYGVVHFYPLPYGKLHEMNYKLGIEVTSYTECVEKAIEEMRINKKDRNVLMAHFFVTNHGISPKTCDSETISCVGGLDNIDSRILEEFDYVGLGHLHGPQSLGTDTIRYAGSPVKYSFSETFHKKSVTVIELHEKGMVLIRKRELKPYHDMRKIKGKLEDLMKEEVVQESNPEDYLHVTLTDTRELVDPIGTLRQVYPNIMQLVFEKNQRKEALNLEIEKTTEKTTMEIYKEFFTYACQRDLEEEQKQIMENMIEKVWSLE